MSIYSDNQNYYEIYEVTAILWIPSVCLLAYLVREQFIARRYPHYLIIFFFALDNLLRCIWMFGSAQSLNNLTFKIINRSAILCQFSGMSMLVLIWKRIDDSILSCGSDVHEKYAKKPICTRQLVIISINVVIWLYILISITQDRSSNIEHDVSILAIIIICLAQAFILFYFGLRTAVRLQRHAEKDSRFSSLTDKISSALTVKEILYVVIFSSRNIDKTDMKFRRKQLAVEYLVFYSSVTGVCSLLRAIAFIYGLVVYENTPIDRRTPSETAVDNIFYPYFYYMIPEMIPNLLITYGISPPHSLFRRVVVFISSKLSRLCTTAKQDESENEADNNNEEDDATGGEGGEDLDRDSIFFSEINSSVSRLREVEAAKTRDDTKHSIEMSEISGGTVSTGISSESVDHKNCWLDVECKGDDNSLILESGSSDLKVSRACAKNGECADVRNNNAVIVVSPLVVLAAEGEVGI